MMHILPAVLVKNNRSTGRRERKETRLWWSGAQSGHERGKSPARLSRLVGHPIVVW
jgi:hypothetical protein